MPQGVIYAIVLIAVIVAILINWRKGINLGIVTAVFAYIVGCLLMNMKASDVVALTPVKVVFQLVAITFFFSFPNQNGTLEMVANKILYRFRHRAWSLPIVLLFIGILLGLIGAPNPMISIIIAVLGFRLAIKAGINPLLISIAAGLNGFASNIPYCQSGTIIANTIGSLEGYETVAEAYAWKYFLCSAVVFLIVAAVFYFILKGYKARAAIDVEKPAPATPEQRKSLVIVAVVVGLVIISNVLAILIPSSGALKTLKGYCDIQMLCLLGGLVSIILKLGNEKEAIVRGVPWGTIIMITGITILLGVAQVAGVTDWLGKGVSNNVNSHLIGPFLALITGLLSFFAGGITAVFPMIAPMVPSIAASSGLSASMLFSSTAIGGNLTTISPFSVGGATILANCPDESLHKKLFRGQLAVALVGMFIGIVMSYIGWFNILIK